MYYGPPIGKRIFPAPYGARRPKAPSFTHKLDCSKVAFDHTAYPHIIRAIIQYASLPGLLPFRATCKEYLNYVDTLLFRHVVAAIPAGNRRGRDIELRGPTSPYPRLPFLPWQASEPPGARRAIRQTARVRQLGMLHVTDFGPSLVHPGDPSTGTTTRDVGNIWHDDYDDGFDDATTDENTLRAASNLMAPFLSSHPRPTPLIVRRRNGSVGGGTVKLHADTYVDYLELPNRQTAFQVPPCRTYVLHLAYNPFDSMHRSAIDIQLPPGIQEVVLVMAPFSSYAPTDTIERKPLGILHDLLWGFLRLVPNAHLTLVGVENMRPATLGYDPGTDRYQLPKQVLAKVRDMLRDLAAEPMNDEVVGFNMGSDPGPPPSTAEMLEAVNRITLLMFEPWEATFSAKDRAVICSPPEYESS